MGLGVGLGVGRGRGRGFNAEEVGFILKLSSSSLSSGSRGDYLMIVPDKLIPGTVQGRICWAQG